MCMGYHQTYVLLSKVWEKEKSPPKDVKARVWSNLTAQNKQGIKMLKVKKQQHKKEVLDSVTSSEPSWANPLFF